MNSDPEQGVFADGLTEDIITALVGVPWPFEIARNFSFVHEGAAVDVRRMGRELGGSWTWPGSSKPASGAPAPACRDSLTIHDRLHKARPKVEQTRLREAIEEIDAVEAADDDDARPAAHGDVEVTGAGRLRAGGLRRRRGPRHGPGARSDGSQPELRLGLGLAGHSGGDPGLRHRAGGGALRRNPRDPPAFRNPVAKGRHAEEKGRHADAAERRARGESRGRASRSCT
ncbi:MAG: hypothetical protein AAF192_08325 [Pseudomonadota bacterium]